MHALGTAALRELAAGEAGVAEPVQAASSGIARPDFDAEELHAQDGACWAASGVDDGIIF